MLNKIGDVRIWAKSGPIIMADGEIWLPADGRLVSRKAYPVLYSKIGMSYADEDKRCCNAELFPLPDLRTEAERNADKETKTDS